MSRTFRRVPRYSNTDVRLMTLRSATFAKSVRIASCTPSLKCAYCVSSLKFSNGNTAMLVAGTPVFTVVPEFPGSCRCTLRRRKIDKLKASEPAANKMITMNGIFGQGSAITGRIAARAAGFHLLLRLNFAGGTEFPRPSLHRLKTFSRSPCFTSHSPKSCKYGRQCP